MCLLRSLSYNISCTQWLSSVQSLLKYEIQIVIAIASAA